MTSDPEAAQLVVAPPDVQALRELVVRISRGEAQVSLGSKALKVLASLVERPDAVAVSSITALATMFGVNASTLSRLARSLGYDSFAQFQRVFRDGVTRAHQRFYSAQGQRLLDDGELDETGGELGVVVQLAQESIRNIDSCLAQLDVGELHAAASRLARARRVRVHGVRQMHALASLLAYGLGLIRPDVGLLDGPGQGVAASLAQMGKGDVLVLSGVSPYSRQAVDVARVAAGAGIALIAITDSRASPLAAHGGETFFIPHASSFISNSLAAHVVFCEGLINLVARELGDKALKALARHERFIEGLHIETR
ncbi:MAG: MurR/RpiR family transcriptional regulator [Azoarcus sp.]|nr:MurR/RpiR family transcriptional regulator [Azoarcus sp.]